MGSRILAGRYELLEKIGEGGMAVVFRAKDRVLSRFVAVKILRPEYTKDQQFIESFRKESQLAASIVDPNIVNVYDVGREGNIYYIVMELVEGLPLSETIKHEAPLDPRRAVSIARQIAMALSTAHRHNLIHRDVKPHNILLGVDDVAKIADFGIAKIVNNDTLVGDQKEAVMGSIHYFSPEQAKGSGVDERSDIYSLGIVLYEMVTGKVPFDGATAVEVAVKHMNEAMVPPSHLVPQIPQDVEDIILKATDKNPDNRYNNVDEMITDLSFVKFSKPSDYWGELQKRKEEGELDFSFLDNPDKPETPEEKRARIREEKAEKKRVRQARKEKYFHPQRIAAAILAVIIAIPLSGVVYNNFFNKNKEVSKDIAVPSIVGKDFEVASEEMLEYDLVVEIDMELSSDEYEIGQIISQSPSAESIVKRGSTIKVNISKGRTESKVPNVIGKKLSDAQSRIESYNYVVGTVKYANDSDIPKDYVISQDPVKDTVAEMGSKINLVVSLGEGGTNTQPVDTNNVTDKGDSYTVVIPPKTNGTKIAEILAGAGIVESKDAFLDTLKEMKYDTKLKSGTFNIKKDASVEDIIKTLAGEN